MRSWFGFLNLAGLKGCVTGQSGKAANNPGQTDLEREVYASVKYNPKKVRSKYTFGVKIADGGFAEVIEVFDKKDDDKLYACKIMALPRLGAELTDEEMTREDVFREIKISAELEHPQIANMREFYVGRKKVYLIFDYMEGGRLLEVVRRKLNEDQARVVFKQLCEAIRYLHSRGVAHRDLKLENILLAKRDDFESVRIVDFGLAKQTSRPLETMCGTLNYVAPDVITRTKGQVYEKSVDMWSVGVLLYILLSGTQPFTGTEEQIFDKIIRAEYTFKTPMWKHISQAAKELITRLLEIDSDKRLTAEQALRHPWVQGYDTSPKARPS